MSREDTLIYWVLPVTLSIVLALVIYVKSRATDPYGLFHLSLNRLPGENADVDPKTEWLNMGYWKNTDVFPEACEALALKLIAAANYQPGGNVLDVGHGSGESLILQLTHPTIPRPSRLTGITSLKTHYQRSSDRIARLQASSKVQGDLQPEVVLYHGDAIFRPEPDSKHPLHPSSSPSISPYTSILALDCAYHFNTRPTFLRQSLHHLAPTGRIALADMCFTPSSLRKLYIRTLVHLFRLMPLENVVSAEEYVRDMEQMGYVDVRLEDISEDLFPGFERFLKGRGGGWWVFGHFVRWWAWMGARFVIVSGAKAKG